MHYLAIKHLHMALALLSLSLLWGRFVYQAATQRTLHKSITALAHSIDFILIGAGVWLLSLIGSLPAGNSLWLLAKVAGLVGYVILGVLALRATDQKARTAWILLATLSFAYVVGAALTKSPWSWFS